MSITVSLTFFQTKETNMYPVKDLPTHGSGWILKVFGRSIHKQTVTNCHRHIPSVQMGHAWCKRMERGKLETYNRDMVDSKKTKY